MKILAFSDVTKWEGYENLVDKVKPDVIALAGDLSWDGFAGMWDIIRLPVRLDNSERQKFWEKIMKVHVKSFYHFLKYAGKRATVLIVKGDHDDDIEGAYTPEKIDNIRGCKEISGKTIDIKDFRFLGLGFNDSYYLKRLKLIIEKFKENVDVVIMHGSNIRFVSLLKPKIIIKGGSITGRYLVNNAPSAFTGPLSYTIIEFTDKTIPKILQYKIKLKGWKIGKDSNFEIKKTRKRRSKRMRKPPVEKVFPLKYEWLKPYPEKYKGERAD